MPTKYSPENPYSAESTETRLARELEFDAQTSQNDYDPAVISNLRTTAEDTWEFERRSRDWWKEDQAALQGRFDALDDEQRKAWLSQGGLPENWTPRQWGFGQWAQGQASQYAKEDPTQAQGYDPRMLAELNREFARKSGRIQGFAYEQEQQERSEGLGAVGQTALGVAEGLMEFGNVASGGTMESAIMGTGEFFDEGYAERYSQGRAMMADLTDRGPSAVRWARGFGGMMGFIVPAGMAGKSATAARAALEAGKTGLVEGTKRYAFNRAVMSSLGGVGPGAGVVARMGSSAGNFAFTQGGLDFLRGINQGVQAVLADPNHDIQNGLANMYGVWNGSEELGEPGIAIGMAQSSLTGAAMPWLQKLGHGVSRFLTKGPNSEALRGAISEIPDIAGKVRGLMANAAGGAVEFGALPLVPSVHGGESFQVVRDLVDVLSGNDPDGRLQEGLWFHLINGAVLKGGQFATGKGQIGLSTGQREKQLAQLSPDRLKGLQAIADAHEASSDNLLIPTAQEIRALQEKTDVTARNKVAMFVTRRALENTLGKDLMDNLTVREGMARVENPTEFEQRVQQEVNHAIDLIGQQKAGVKVVGKGPKVTVETIRGRVQKAARLTPEEATRLHRNVKREIAAQGEAMSNEELDGLVNAILQRKGTTGQRSDPQREGGGYTTQQKNAIRKGLRDLMENTPEEERSALAAELFGLTATAEAAARMGMAPLDGQPIVERVLEGLAQRAQDALRQKENPTLEDKIRTNTMDLEDLYKQIDATQDLGQKRALAERAAKIEEQNEQMKRGVQAEATREAEKIDAEQQQGIEPGTSIRRPLSVGEKPEPIDAPVEGDIAFPDQIVQVAGGQRLRIQVGKYDKEGVYRPATVVGADPNGLTVQTQDGTFYRVTPDDVKTGKARGELFSGIGEGPGDYPVGKPPPLTKDARDQIRDFERREITERGDTIESTEYREPDPMFGRAPTPGADEILFAMRQGKPGEGSKEDFRALKEFMRSNMLEAEAGDDAGRFVEANRIMQELQKSRGVEGVQYTADHPKFPKPGEGGEAAGGVKKAPKPKKPKGGGKARFGSKKKKKKERKRRKKGKTGKLDIKQKDGESPEDFARRVIEEAGGEIVTFDSIREGVREKEGAEGEARFLREMLQIRAWENGEFDFGIERIDDPDVILDRDGKERDVQTWVSTVREADNLKGLTGDYQAWAAVDPATGEVVAFGIRGDASRDPRKADQFDRKAAQRLWRKLEAEGFKFNLSDVDIAFAADLGASVKPSVRFGSKKKKGKGKKKALKRRVAELEGKLKDAQEKAFTDPLTKLPNQRAWEEAKKRIEDDDSRSVLRVDVREFGPYNKAKGQDAGDEVLTLIGKRLTSAAKKAGIPLRDVFRSGGDEFSGGGTIKEMRKFFDLLKRRPYVTDKDGDKVFFDLGLADRKAADEAGVTKSRLADKHAQTSKELARTGAAPPSGTPSPKGGKPPRLGSKKPPKPQTNAEMRDEIKTLAANLGIDAGKIDRAPKAELLKQLEDLRKRTEDRSDETTRVHKIPGQPRVISVSNIPEGFTVYKAVKSGRNWQVLLKDKDGTIWLLNSGKEGGIQKPGPEWREPAATKDVSVVDVDDNLLLRGPSSVTPGVTPSAPPEPDTGRVTNIAQARARLGAFRRKNIIVEEDGQTRIASKTEDPIKRAYDITGAMMAKEGMSSADIKEQIRFFTNAINKAIQTDGPTSDKVQRMESALKAMRHVAEAKTFEEAFNRAAAREKEFKARSAAESNPATDIDNSDEALTTSQKKARDLSVQYRASIETEIKKMRALAKAERESDKPDKKKATEYRQRLDTLRKLRRIANSLIDAAPGSREHTSQIKNKLRSRLSAVEKKLKGKLESGERSALLQEKTELTKEINKITSGDAPVDISIERLPPVGIGDTVRIVYGGERGGRLVEGLIVGGGEPSRAALRRGVGESGREVRRLLKKQKRGGELTDAELKLVRSSSLFPGKWITVFTPTGKRVRIRVSDIAEIGPKDIDDDTFSYDPGRDRFGTEVSERRFLSWFKDPYTVPTSRNPKGTGDAEQSSNRVTALLRGDSDGYWKSSGRGEETVVTDLTGLEAAETEAKVRASQVRNRTITAEQAQLEANAMLVRPEDRHQFSFDYVAEGELEKGEKSRQAKAKRQMVLNYFDPTSRLRDYSELSDADKIRHDHWVEKAQEAEARDMRASDAKEEWSESRKALVPLYQNDDTGEYIFAHRTRNDDGILRQGRVVTAERTPEGTIHARYMSTAEAKKWLSDNGHGEDWAKWRKESEESNRRIRMRNDKIISLAKGHTALHEMGMLLQNQFERIAKDPKAPIFPHEGDLHEMVRAWLKENPYPGKGSDAEARWEKEWNNFLFRSPGRERSFRAVGASGEAETEQHFDPATGERTLRTVRQPVERAVGMDEDFFGKRLEGAGPLFMAEQRMFMRRNPSNGDQLIYDEKTDEVRYKDPKHEARDFFKAYAQGRGIDLYGRPKPKGFHPGTLGMFGVGGMPGGAMRHWRNFFSWGAEMSDKALRGYNRLTSKPAHLWSQVLGGVTDFSKGVTDAVFFDHLHDLLHHPDFGSKVLGETGKAFARKVGIWFGESDEAPLARLHLNDYEGQLYELGSSAARAVQKLRAMPREEQMRLLKEFESGKTPKILEEYRDIMDELGDRLVEKGMLDEADLKRFKGRYIHYGRWLWKKADVQKALEDVTREWELAKQDPTKDSARVLDLYKERNLLRSALAKMRLPNQRVFIGSHPLDRVRKGDIRGVEKAGANRFRTSKGLADAESKGLDTSEPWRLLLEGMAVEGRALAQAMLYDRVAADRELVRDIDDAPSDWVAIVDERYTSHPLWSRFQGKRIHPQMYHLLEANDPDYSRLGQAWDMYHGLIKSSYTVGSLSNWHTQVLGNIMITASAAKGIPFFQIPSRFARAILTLTGKGKGAKERLEKYKRWNWTRHASDAVRELARALDYGGQQTRADPEGSPYLGMGFGEKLAEIARSARRGKVKRAARGFGIALVDVFTSLDAMARVAMHEWQVEQGMSEVDSRKRVDKFYDIQHLPKGWQFMRRYVDSFASIKALMGRNLAELAPATPAAMINLGTARIIHNMIMQQIYGMNDEDTDRLIDAHVPKNNAFHEYFGKNVAFMFPKGNGLLGVIDMSKFSPTDVGIRGIPGLRQIVSGIDSLVWDGDWQDDIDGKNIADGLFDYGTQNIVAGGSINFFAGRNPYSPERNMQDQYEKPGLLGMRGYWRYFWEDGPGAALATAALPAGLREAVTPLARPTMHGIKRFAQASEGGALGVEPRFVVEMDKSGNIVSRQYSTSEAIGEAFGFRSAYNSPTQRLQEVLERETDMVKPGPFGLKRTYEGRTSDPESHAARAAREAVKDSRDVKFIHKAMRFSGIVQAYEDGDEASREVIGKMITRELSSPGILNRMRNVLAMLEQTDMLNTVTNFFSNGKHKEFRPRRQRPKRPDPGRFGSLKRK